MRAQIKRGGVLQGAIALLAAAETAQNDFCKIGGDFALFFLKSTDIRKEFLAIRPGRYSKREFGVVCSFHADQLMGGV